MALSRFLHKVVALAIAVLILVHPVSGQAVHSGDSNTVKLRLARARIQSLSEEALRSQLENAPEVGLSPKTMEVLLKAYPLAYDVSARLTKVVNFDPKPLVVVCPPAGNLPLLSGAACRLDPASALTLQTLSRKLRLYLAANAPLGIDNKRIDPARLEFALRRERRGPQPEWLRPEAIPTLMQMLMHEDRPVRRMLVELLSEIPGPAANVALAQRALFDLAPDVRQSALEALLERPYADFRHVLLEGMRYPWPTIAEHAAEALIALGDRDAVPALVTLLDEADPRFVGGGKPEELRVREVIKTNHLNNCLLCHPPALGFSDPVPGVIPGLIQQVPVTLTSAQAANVQSSATSVANIPGGHNYGASGSSATNIVPSNPSVIQTSTTTRTVVNTQQTITLRLPVIVRGDITYLRQDFSVQQPVESPGQPLPVNMRFDYLVQTRPLNRGELQDAPGKRAEMPPHRLALLYVLRELSGKDAGPETADWQKIYPHARRDADAMRLKDALLRTAPGQRQALLSQYKSARGDAYAWALATALPHLKGAERNLAREVLGAHLARLAPRDLRLRLQDDDAEIHRAAALVCTEKTTREYLPELIECLQDPDQAVARAARQALIRVSGRTLGPPSADAPPEAYAEAAQRWTTWWQTVRAK